MSTLSQIEPLSGSTRLHGQPPFSRPWFLAASALIYLAVLLGGTLRSYAHLHVCLLVLQYFLILPAAIKYLRAQADQGSPSISTPKASLSVVVGCFALVALPMSWFSTQGLLNPDESGYSFQARIYRSGRIMADPLIGATSAVKATPDEIHFADHIVRPYGWFAKTPPGWPLVLSLGYLLSAHWILTPIFGLVQLLVSAACGARCFSREAGVSAVFLAALSSFYLVNSIGTMSHALCGLLAATACLALFTALATRNCWFYALMFACASAMLLVRPYTGFVLTLVLTIAALWLNGDMPPVLLRVIGIGAIFGTISLACMLIYNHTYTHNWLVSPYALAAGSDTPTELSFNPIKILRAIRFGAWQTTEESLIGIFPFAYLLAGYTLFREKTYRRESWILASVHIGLVLAYLAHIDGSGVFFGERFHFEGFFALMLLAGRGAELLAANWRIPRRALYWTVVLLALVQVAQQAAAVNVIARRCEPYRRIREAVATSNVSGLVLLHDSPGFVAKHFNLNDADWRHAPRFFLVDADPNHRGEWACRYRVNTYTVAAYDDNLHRATLFEGKADCSNPTTPAR